MSSYVTGIVTLACINIIAVTGVSVLTGFTRLFSFGNAGFMAVGAYTSALLTTRLRAPFIPALACGSALACLAAYLLGRLTLRLKGDYFLITTLGFGESVRLLIEFLTPVTGGARGLAGIPPHTTLPVTVASMVVAVAVARNFITSKYGRNLQAIREQEMAASAAGIDVTSFKNLAFCMSAAYAGWAGGLLVHYVMFATPVMFNLGKSAELTITVVIGGLGSLTGSVVASAVLTVLPEVLRAAESWRMVLYGVAVVAIIIAKPSGLLGYRELSLSVVSGLLSRRRPAGRGQPA